MLNREELLRDFPQLSTRVHDKPLIYLDNAASTLKLKSMTDRLADYYYHKAANIHRGVHWLSEMGTLDFEKTRDAVAELINAYQRHEVIFTKGTTESINLLAHGIGRSILKPGNVILVSTLEHHSNIVPWQMAAELAKARVVEIPVDDNGDIDLISYESLLKNNPVKLVSTAAISNALGTVNPIATMVKMAHSHGALFNVDAAQAMAHQKVDVRAWDCDFIAFSSHKMFGPYGVGVFWGREKLLNALPPYQGGGDMIDQVSFQGSTWQDLPHKLEAGTPVIAEVLAFKEAVTYVANLNFDKLHAYERNLRELLESGLRDIRGLKIIGTAKEKCSVTSFVLEGAHHHDLGTLLDQMGIAVRTGHHCTQPLMQRFKISGTTRASLCLYNTKEEVEALVKGIHKAQGLL